MGRPVRETGTGPAGMAFEASGRGMSEDQDRAQRIELARLRQEHRDLDAAITALVASGVADSLQIQRLKKRKLVLKDSITRLEDQLLPDIIA